MGREFDHSSPSSTEIKNEWSSPSAPPYVRGQGQIYIYSIAYWIKFWLNFGWRNSNTLGSY